MDSAVTNAKKLQTAVYVSFIIIHAARIGSSCRSELDHRVFKDSSQTWDFRKTSGFQSYCRRDMVNLVEMYWSWYRRRLPGVPLNRWLVSHGGRVGMVAGNILTGWDVYYSRSPTNHWTPQSIPKKSFFWEVLTNWQSLQCFLQIIVKWNKSSATLELATLVATTASASQV